MKMRFAFERPDLGKSEQSSEARQHIGGVRIGLNPGSSNKFAQAGLLNMYAANAGVIELLMRDRHVRLMRQEGRRLATPAFRLQAGGS